MNSVHQALRRLLTRHPTLPADAILSLLALAGVAAVAYLVWFTVASS